MNYSELITLGVITFGGALNAKCNNAKCNKLIVTSQKCLLVSIPWLGSWKRIWRQRQYFHLSERQTNPGHIHYVIQVSVKCYVYKSQFLALGRIGENGEER